MTSKIFKYFRILAVFLVAFIVFFSLPNFCTGHDHQHEHAHHQHEHDHHHHDEPPAYKYSEDANAQSSQSESSSSYPPPRPRKQMSISRLWMEALSSTLIISIAPFLILFFVPLNHRRGHESLLKVGLSFASGGLLGDAFLHLIPHALQPHSHDHEQSHNHDHSHAREHSHDHEHNHDSTGAWVLIGILAFLILDKCMRLVKGEHSHSHSHGELLVDEKSAKGEDEKEKEKEKKKDEPDNSDAMSESDEDIKPTAFLNLIVDFVHNLTDGLAIGASYLAGETVGLVTTVTVLLHEVPHEIGDFAILVQSGCSKKKAMLFQLVTALGAFLGTFISLVSGGVDAGATSWALPFTAGGFIYISTVSIIPELLTDTSFGQSIKEILALLTGVSLMVIVAQFE